MVYQTDAPDGFYFNKGTPAAPSWLLLSTGSTPGSDLGQTFLLNFVAPSTTNTYHSPLSGTILGVVEYRAVGNVFPVSATFDALYVNLFTTASGSSDATTVTLYKNGVATDLTVTLSASPTANTLVAANSTATVSVSPGDILTIVSSHSVAQNNFRFNITTHCH